MAALSMVAITIPIVVMIAVIVAPPPVVILLVAVAIPELPVFAMRVPFPLLVIHHLAVIPAVVIVILGIVHPGVHAASTNHQQPKKRNSYGKGTKITPDVAHVVVHPLRAGRPTESQFA